MLHLRLCFILRDIIYSLHEFLHNEREAKSISGIYPLEDGFHQADLSHFLQQQAVTKYISPRHIWEPALDLSIPVMEHNTKKF